MTNRSLWTGGGMVGVLAVACYIAAIVIPWPETQLGNSLGLVCVSAWPVLSMVYGYAFYHYVSVQHDSVANRLGFIFLIVAFTTVLAMIVVQMAVGAGLPEIITGLDETTARALKRGLRMIDLGLDVAWDILIGTALIFTGWAARVCPGFGRGWGIPAMLLGIALIGLNAATFPWPPGDRGLFDIGPFIGVFVMLQAARLTFLGKRVTA